MTHSELKTIADATVDLGRKTTEVMTDLGTTTFNNVASFAVTVTKAQSELLRSHPSTSVFSDMFDTWSKMQSEVIKSYTQWTDSVRSNLNK